MNDREKWELGVVVVREGYGGLSPESRAKVGSYTTAIKSRKRELHLIAEAVGASAVCTQCKGECCKAGKGHVRSVDLIAYLNDGREIFSPCFHLEICPYLGESGCMMAPEYRPYNCITFICEQVEELLGAPERERCNSLEHELRDLYACLERLFERPLRGSLLGVCELQRQEEPHVRGAEMTECKEIS